jgi:hypothetical protein
MFSHLDALYATVFVYCGQRSGDTFLVQEVHRKLIAHHESLLSQAGILEKARAAVHPLPPHCIPSVPIVFINPCNPIHNFMPRILLYYHSPIQRPNAHTPGSLYGLAVYVGPKIARLRRRHPPDVSRANLRVSIRAGCSSADRSNRRSSPLLHAGQITSPLYGERSLPPK